MKHAVRKFTVAAAIAGLSLGAWAQTYTSPATSTPKATGSSTTQAESDFQAAQAKCNALAGIEKNDCLAKAKAAYDQPQKAQLNSGQSGATGATGQAGTSAGASGGASGSAGANSGTSSSSTEK
jgi:hypothetical protein